MFVEFLQVFLPLVIYILLIVVLIVLIVVGFKFANFLDKINHVVDSVSQKIDSLNGLFHVIDFATDKVSEFSTAIVERVISTITKFSRRKNKNKEDEDDE